MSTTLSSVTPSEYRDSESASVEAEAVTRMRLVALVSLLAEIILPAVEIGFFPMPDWLTIELQSIWFVCSVVLFAATWHPGFRRIWKITGLLFSTALLVSSGILSVKGAMLAPFMFLIALLPPAGTVLPWEPSWQAGLNAITLLFGLFFSCQFEWPNQLVISGLSAMIVSILGSHLVTAGLTRQRDRIRANLQALALSEEKLRANLQALALSEEKFRKIFETSGSLIAIHSIPDGRTVDVNPAWERTFGYERNEALGKLPAELALTLDGGDFADWVSSVKSGDAGVEQVPVVFRGHRGNSVHCLYSWTALELNGRDCVLVIGQDITARVQAEEELNRNREVLINQERLKAVGELASGIAHDLNNSLNALRLRVELLCADSALPRHNDSLLLISRIVRDASTTIGRLQDFARVRHDRPVESVNLNTIISQSIEIAKSTLEEKNSLLGRSIRIVSELSDLPLVLAEPTELRQIFLNLLLNAQDAMPSGGIIRILGHIEGDVILVQVEDEGQGVREEHLSRIFDPFFSTKGERGTGLGLSIAYAAMARIGGTISAANRAEGGATFTLTFPIAKAKPLRQEQHGSASIRPLRLLVTDDDQDNLQAFSSVLESRGHTVIKANSGLEALDKLMEGNAPVDVVFCDLGMPLMNGWEIARRVKSIDAPPTVYLVTGWASEIPGNDPRRRLVDGVIAKPVDLAILDQLLADQEPNSAPRVK
jgi:PAS domain S-box-containing protein